MEDKNTHSVMATYLCEPPLFPGYGIEVDLHMLARSWMFVADIVGCPERVVELQTFSRMVRSLALFLCGWW